MRESDNTNPVWVSLVAAIAVIGIILIGYKLLQTQRHVEAIQTELERANERTLELEKHTARLSAEREDAVRQRIDSQDKLDEATTDRNELQSELDQSTSTIQELQKKLEQAQSAFDDTQFRLTVLRSELESLKQNLGEANAKADNATAKRTELEVRLNLAKLEIDRLKAALEQAKKVPVPESQQHRRGAGNEAN
jgi:chromosome segregation ATPase